MKNEIASGAKMKSKLGTVFSAVALGVALSHAALVTPNPHSLLKAKKVLVLTGGQLQDHGPAKDATLNNLKALSTSIPFSLTVGNPLTLTDAILAPYDVIIFNYFFETQLTTVLPEASKTAFIAWLKKPGKGYVGYHTSGANEYAKGEWVWYQDNVTGMRYGLHGNGTPQGIIAKTTDAAILASPIMEGLPATYTANDEWYDFDTTSSVFKDGSKVLFYLSNAKDMTPPRLPSPIHPVAWCRQDAAGTRYFYTPFGHTADGANSDWFRGIVLRGLEYVSGYDTEGVSITKNTLSNVLAGAPAYLSAGQALSIDIPGKYQLSVWSLEGQKLVSASGENKRSFALAPFKKAGIYIVTVDAKNAHITQRISIY